MANVKKIKKINNNTYNRHIINKKPPVLENITHKSTIDAIQDVFNSQKTLESKVDTIFKLTAPTEIQKKENEITKTLVEIIQSLPEELEQIKQDIKDMKSSPKEEEEKEKSWEESPEGILEKEIDLYFNPTKEAIDSFIKSKFISDELKNIEELEQRNRDDLFKEFDSKISILSNDLSKKEKTQNKFQSLRDDYSKELKNKFTIANLLADNVTVGGKIAEKFSKSESTVGKGLYKAGKLIKGFRENGIIGTIAQSITESRINAALNKEVEGFTDLEDKNRREVEDRRKNLESSKRNAASAEMRYEFIKDRNNNFGATNTKEYNEVVKKSKISDKDTKEFGNKLSDKVRKYRENKNSVDEWISKKNNFNPLYVNYFKEQELKKEDIVDINAKQKVKKPRKSKKVKVVPSEVIIDINAEQKVKKPRKPKKVKVVPSEDNIDINAEQKVIKPKKVKGLPSEDSVEQTVIKPKKVKVVPSEDIVDINTEQKVIQPKKVKGFSVGGFTGSGDNSEVAGVVHKNEYVLNPSETKKITKDISEIKKDIDKQEPIIKEIKDFISEINERERKREEREATEISSKGVAKGPMTKNWDQKHKGDNENEGGCSSSFLDNMLGGSGTGKKFLKGLGSVSNFLLNTKGGNALIAGATGLYQGYSKWDEAEEKRKSGEISEAESKAQKTEAVGTGLGSAVGTFGGMGLGRLLGGAIGAVGGPLGILIGQQIGAVAGGYFGEKLGNYVGSAGGSSLGHFIFGGDEEKKNKKSGFLKGGYTGSGDPKQVAGVVHKGEFVINHDQISQLSNAGSSAEKNKILQKITKPLLKVADSNRQYIPASAGIGVGASSMEGGASTSLFGRLKESISDSSIGTTYDKVKNLITGNGYTTNTEYNVGKYSGITGTPIPSDDTGKPPVVSVEAYGPGWNIVKRADGSIEKRKGDRNWRNNNPGNLEARDWEKDFGMLQSDGRFGIFKSYADGRNAKRHLLFEKVYKDKTLSYTISKYAPPGENNTNRYIGAVLSAVGGKDMLMGQYSKEEQEKIMNAMQKMEGMHIGKVELIQKGTGTNTSPSASNTTPGGQGSPQQTTSTNVQVVGGGSPQPKTAQVAGGGSSQPKTATNAQVVGSGSPQPKTPVSTNSQTKELATKQVQVSSSSKRGSPQSSDNNGQTTVINNGSGNKSPRTATATGDKSLFNSSTAQILKL